jgi:hypothetical protein
MAARPLSNLSRITVLAHLCVAGCLGWISIAMASTVVGLAHDPLITPMLGACAAFGLVVSLVLLSGIRRWLRGEGLFRLVWADLLAVFAAPLALLPSAFVTGELLNVSTAGGVVCLVLLVFTRRAAPPAPIPWP